MCVSLSARAIGLALIGVVLVAAMTACGNDGDDHAADVDVPVLQGLPDTVTFAEVAPIIRANCMPCHREGQAGPFALVSYRDIRRKAKTRVKKRSEDNAKPVIAMMINPVTSSMVRPIASEFPESTFFSTKRTAMIVNTAAAIRRTAKNRVRLRVRPL